MANHKIWVEAHSDDYDRKKSFGGNSNIKQTIYVGTSAKNSHKLGKISIKREEDADGNDVFCLSLDRVKIKKGVLKKDKTFTRNWAI